MRRLQSIVWIFLLLACVERLDVPSVVVTPSLVVDGLLTDQPGPQVVILTLSGSPADDPSKPTYFTGATVEVVDGTGNAETFLEMSPGHYQSSDSFQGVVGEKYQLRIQTASGDYQSELTEMLPAGKIENVYAEFHENSINANDLTAYHDAIEVFLDGTGATGYPNLLRWRWRGTYYVITFPQFRTKIVEGGLRIPDPFPCSGYELRGGQLTYVRPCECCECWATDYSPTAHVSNNTVIREADFNRIFVTRVPVDNWRFIDKYYLEVEQMSVNEDAYQFWKLVQAQQEGAGNLFQPNIVQVKGNVASLSDPAEVVYGVFSVSSIARETIVLDRQVLPKPVPTLDTVVADCRNYFNNSTNVKPPFW